MSQLSPLETHNICDATIRAMVVQLQDRCQQKYDSQTCYYWLAYEDFDADAALRRLQTGGDLHPPPPPPPSNHAHDLSHTETGVFPTEIWQIICAYLPTSDLKTIRLVNRALADVGAELLISHIRIDTSFESFKRLKQVADHVLIRKGVKKLFYEAGLLANVGCFHYYSRYVPLKAGLDEWTDPAAGTLISLTTANHSPRRRNLTEQIACTRETWPSSNGRSQRNTMPTGNYSRRNNSWSTVQRSICFREPIDWSISGRSSSRPAPSARTTSRSSSFTNTVRTVPSPSVSNLLTPFGN